MDQAHYEYQFRRAHIPQTAGNSACKYNFLTHLLISIGNLLKSLCLETHNEWQGGYLLGRFSSHHHFSLTVSTYLTFCF